MESGGSVALPSKEPPLRRVVGLPGAIFMGLGSILGTGVFVSIGIAAGVAGSGVILAVGLAAVVAACNGLSSAQLAASHPVSGGTYEYGYRYLTPQLGFIAGWMFLFAKSASAATAALGFAGYLLSALGGSDALLRVGLAVAAVVGITALVASGMGRSSRANVVIVSITLLALLGFASVGSHSALASWARSLDHLRETEGGLAGILHATALMFVAYTGYGRIATLGEEVRNPSRTIPRAIIVTLFAVSLLYLLIATVGVAVAGSSGLAAATAWAAAPLEVVALQLGVPGLAWLVAVGAVTAMLGVLLNLLLGLSRVLLAMARRRDMPTWLAAIDRRGATPTRSVLSMGALVAVLALAGDVKITWSFSAFTVLVYYAITNLSALRLPEAQRRYPPWIAATGLVACLGLAFWVEPVVWGAGLAVVGLGLAWHAVSVWSRARRA